MPTRGLVTDRNGLAALCRRHHVRRLALFGSVLRGGARPDSDVDVLVEFEPGRAPGLRFIEVIGEAASKVSEAARFELESVPWHEIVGMRNRLVHSYAAVDHDIIWAVATADPPALATDLEAGVDERT
jgi:predicted nucleotidyltransferase